MAVPEREHLEEAGADWYEWLFRGSEAFTALLEAADLDVGAGEFERTDAYRPGGIRRGETVVLVLQREGTSTDPLFEGSPEDYVEHLSLTARFDGEDDTLLEVELQTGSAGELAGGGEFWQYRDGDVEHGNWTA